MASSSLRWLSRRCVSSRFETASANPRRVAARLPTGIAFIFSRYAITSATSSGARLPGSFFGIRVLDEREQVGKCFPFHHLANVAPVCDAGVWQERQLPRVESFPGSPARRCRRRSASTVPEAPSRQSPWQLEPWRRRAGQQQACTRSSAIVHSRSCRKNASVRVTAGRQSRIWSAARREPGARRARTWPTQRPR